MTIVSEDNDRSLSTAPNRYQVIIRSEGEKKCPGDKLPVREAKTLTQDYVISVTFEFSEVPTPHEHRIVSIPLLEGEEDVWFDYDEGDRLCGKTDATVRVIVRVGDQEKTSEKTYRVGPADHLLEKAYARIPLVSIDNMSEYLERNLPEVVLEMVLEMSEEGEFSVSASGKKYFVNKARNTHARLATKRLVAIRDDESRREDFIRRGAGFINELIGENERVSKAALARKFNLGNDARKTRTQAMTKRLKAEGVTMEDLERAASQAAKSYETKPASKN
jgi:hypothetical protein